MDGLLRCRGWTVFSDAEDTQAGAEDGPDDGPVLGLLLTCC
jgi:hypothetical protein